MHLNVVHSHSYLEDVLLLGEAEYETGLKPKLDQNC